MHAYFVAWFIDRVIVVPVHLTFLLKLGQAISVWSSSDGHSHRLHCHYYNCSQYPDQFSSVLSMWTVRTVSFDIALYSGMCFYPAPFLRRRNPVTVAILAELTSIRFFFRIGDVFDTKKWSERSLLIDPECYSNIAS